MKYLNVYHLDFWWAHYGFEGVPEKAVEVWITDDKEGKQTFFGFDIGTVGNLRDYIDFETEWSNQKLYGDETERETNEMMIEHYHQTIAECKELEAYYDKLSSGEIYCFIQSLSFTDYNPDIDTCNSLRGTGRSILELRAPQQRPIYADVYVNEVFINSMDSLIACLKKLFLELGMGEEEFRFRKIITREEAKENL